MYILRLLHYLVRLVERKEKITQHENLRSWKPSCNEWYVYELQKVEILKVITCRWIHMAYFFDDLIMHRENYVSFLLDNFYECRPSLRKPRPSIRMDHLHTIKVSYEIFYRLHYLFLELEVDVPLFGYLALHFSCNLDLFIPGFVNIEIHNYAYPTVHS